MNAVSTQFYENQKNSLRIVDASMNPRKKSTGKTKSDEVFIPDKLYFRIGEVASLCRLPAYVLRFCCLLYTSTDSHGSARTEPDFATGSFPSLSLIRAPPCSCV